MQLRFADLNFDAQFRSDGILPSFRGTTLRGAFGFMLKKTMCHITGQRCQDCILQTRCAYPVVFEGVPPEDRTFMRKYAAIPQPLVLNVDCPTPTAVRAGQPLRFGVRLLGPAADLFPFVVYAVLRMGEAGLGRDRVPFEIRSVSDGLEEVYQKGDHGIRAPRVRCVGIQGKPCPATRVRLQMHTPLRVRVDGHLTPTLSVQALLRAAIRRFRILTYFYGQPDGPSDLSSLFAQADAARIVEDHLGWMDLCRFSSRQREPMKLGGVVGHLVLDLPPGQLLEWFRVAEAVHLGKATSFGFGRIACEELKE